LTSYGDVVISKILKVRSQQIVTTPITELYSDIIQKDRRYEPDFSI